MQVVVRSLEYTRVTKEIENAFAYNSFTIVSNARYGGIDIKYAVEHIALVDLLGNDRVKRGNVVGITRGRRIDVDDVFIITQKGCLVLSLTKETYYRLGLVGKTSKIRDKYIIEIDLLKEYSQKQLDRIKWAFNNVLSDKYEFYTVDLSSQQGTRINQIIGGRIKETDFKIKMPDFAKKRWENVDEEEMLDLIEWMGLVQIDSDILRGDADAFISVSFDSLREVEQEVFVQEMAGMMHPVQVKEKMEEILGRLKEEDWVFIVLTGFRDAPKSNFREKEQYYMETGENDLILMGNKHGFLLVRSFEKECRIQK